MPFNSQAIFFPVVYQTSHSVVDGRHALDSWSVPRGVPHTCPCATATFWPWFIGYLFANISDRQRFLTPGVTPYMSMSHHNCLAMDHYMSVCECFSSTEFLLRGATPYMSMCHHNFLALDRTSPFYIASEPLVATLPLDHAEQQKGQLLRRRRRARENASTVLQFPAFPFF